MQKRVGVFSTVLALLMPAAASSQDPIVKLNPRTDARIEALVQSVVGKSTPGLAVAVIHRGQLVHAGAYGLADLDTKQSFTLNTPTYIASVAKMFTAFAILQQIDQGKLSFDTSLGEALPDAPAYARAVTIRQLLTHTSGLADHLDIGGDDRTYTYADVLRILHEADSLLFAPQTRSSYSNSAYVLLARILERTTGTSFPAYLQNHFFRPAGMTNAKVVRTNAERPGQRAKGYSADATGFQLNDYDASSTTGAGGVYASLEDLYRWALAMRAGSLLRPATLRTASTAAVRSNGRPTPWGMGWLAEFHGERDPLKGKTYVAANGQLRGFQASLKWYQDEDLIIIWAANSSSSEVFDAMHEIAGLMLL